MVWLAAFGGLRPIGDPGSTVTVGSQSFVLWSGIHPTNKSHVFTFVASKTLNSYTGDLVDFFQYLVGNNGVGDTLILATVQAGTEIAVGSSIFTTSKYSLAGS